MQFKGDPVPSSGLRHQGVQRARVAQVGWTALGAPRAVWARSCVVVDVAADLAAASTSGSCVSLWAPQRLLQEGGCAAPAGSHEGRPPVENGVSYAESVLLDGDLGAEPSFLGDGDVDDSAKAVSERGLFCLGAEEKAVRPGMAGTIRGRREGGARAVARDWRRTSWVVSLWARSSFSWSLRRQISGATEGGSHKSEAFVVSSLPPCRILKR